MKKGQALVEFIIILPIFLMLVLGIVDLGRIIYQKNVLESQMSDVIMLYDRGKSKEDITEELELTKNNITLNIANKDFLLEKQIEVITPGLNLVLGNPYKIKISRVVK